MSQKKRAAAAEIFRQQNILNEMPAGGAADEDSGELRDAPVGGYLSQPAPAAPPAPIAALPPQALPRSTPSPALPGMFSLKTSEELQLEKEPIQVRETGFGFWKRVVIPPNAYVVHTRLGKKEPVTLGLGMSFRYNPATDAYLVVPAAMQTIGVVANCITREKQGINVLAYVQWQIDQFAIAYRKLDISDPRDPLGIVNAQLREQAEAAIKDKIATMSVEEVLTDKAPVIEELTRRLIAVTEGRLQSAGGSAGEGLGIRIVTVQIKEARVSSQRLWENLQAPFRHEQEKEARLSYLRMQDDISQRELATRQLRETREAEARVVIERIQQSKQTEGDDIRLEEEAKRFAREQTAGRQKLQLEAETTLLAEESSRRLAAERARLQQVALLEQLEREQQAEVERTRLAASTATRQQQLQIDQKLQQLQDEARLEASTAAAEQERLAREGVLRQAQHAFALQNAALAAEQARQALVSRLAAERETTLANLSLEEAAALTEHRQAELRAQQARWQQEARNLINEQDLQRLLIEMLPRLAEQMPAIQELRVLQTGSDAGGLNAFLATLLAAIETARDSLRRPAPPA